MPRIYAVYTWCIRRVYAAYVRRMHLHSSHCAYTPRIYAVGRIFTPHLYAVNILHANAVFYAVYILYLRHIYAVCTHNNYAVYAP